jgi:hypothetical protein
MDAGVDNMSLFPTDIVPFDYSTGQTESATLCNHVEFVQVGIQSDSKRASEGMHDQLHCPSRSCPAVTSVYTLSGNGERQRCLDTWGPRQLTLIGESMQHYQQVASYARNLDKPDNADHEVSTQVMMKRPRTLNQGVECYERLLTS